MADSLISNATTRNALTLEEIEANKEKLNLRPALEFIENNRALYSRTCGDLLDKSSLDSFHPSYKFLDVDKIRGPQLNSDDINSIVSSLPKTLQNLSQLQHIIYYGDVPVPKFDENGNFIGPDAFVPYDDFSKNALIHPSRILIGCTSKDGSAIYQTPLPDTVSKSVEARVYYQTHVFLHEFFHTILNRTPEQLKNVKLKNTIDSVNKEFTLEDFVNNFEKLYLDKNRPSVSRYASTYAHKLNSEFKTIDPENYATALREQMCESFAGYVLNILPNNSSTKYFKHAAPQEYGLIEMLAKSELIQK